MTDQVLRNSLQPGHKLHWYRIERVLGQGGFGITYLAHDANLERHVAIKEYLPMELAVREGDFSVYPASEAHGDRYRWGLDRFLTEARTLAKFKHPAIVRVLSVFEDNNTAYMVMEYERGESLQHVLDQRKTLSETELLALARPILDGLELIHAHGFIHRDIKPANIFVRADHSPVLLDFGSARQALGEQTRTLTSIVSPGYAPFEQYYSKGDRQGPWTDIYGFGATLYRAVSGVQPMDAIDRSEAILKAQRDVFVSAAELGGERYSERFLRAIDHALQFNEKKRPQTVAQWRDEFGFDDIVTQPADPQPATPDADADAEQKTRFTTAAETGPEVPTEIAMSGVIRTEPESQPRAEVSTEPGLENRLRRRVPKVLAVTAGVALVSVAAFWWLGNRDRGAPQLATRPPISDATGQPADTTMLEQLRQAGKQLFDFAAGKDVASVSSLVRRGDRALSAGRVYEPEAGSALGFYRDALALDPGQPEAIQGLELVTERLVSDFHAFIEQDDLDQAARILAIAEDVPVLRRQSGELRQTYETHKAVQTTRQAEQARINAFLRQAELDISEGRLLGPGIDNALARYRAVQILDPDNPAVETGIARIADMLAEDVRKAITGRDFERAAGLLVQLKPLHSHAEEVDALTAALANARQQHTTAQRHAARVEELLSKADTDLKALRLTTPAKGNALERYRAVLAIEPDNVRAHEGVAEVGRKYTQLVQQAVDRRDLDRALALLDNARKLASGTRELEAAEAKVDDLRLTLEREQAARLEREQQKRIEDQERLRAEAEAARIEADAERRRRQEAEALRILAEEERRIEQDKMRAAREVQEAKRKLVLRFDGFDDKYRRYGLDKDQIRVDLEQRLSEAGYVLLAPDQALQAPTTNLLIVRFRANQNTASGIVSYSASLSQHERVTLRANSDYASTGIPNWTKGRTGHGLPTDLVRVRRIFSDLVGDYLREVGTGS